MDENISSPLKKRCAAQVGPGRAYGTGHARTAPMPTLSPQVDLPSADCSEPGPPVTVVRLFSCPVHVYVGHFGRAPGGDPMRESTTMDLVAGRGIAGDRYFDYPRGHKGQVTLFAEEAWERLCAEFGRSDLGPGVFRRNLITRGADLPSLVGREFGIQGVRFIGSEYCKPCAWMDSAFAPGAFEALSEWRAGGLRARVLCDGLIRTA